MLQHAARKLLAITVLRFADPSAYMLGELEMPILKDPKELIVRVHAASINPIDVKKAGGKSKFAVSEKYDHLLPRTSFP